LKVRAGAKLWFSINKGNVVAASPDIEVRYAVAKLLDVYGGIGGSYEFTSLATTFRENRYYNMNERMEANDYTPFDFFVVFKFSFNICRESIGYILCCRVRINTHRTKLIQAVASNDFLFT
jgi:hypothetical protein